MELKGRITETKEKKSETASVLLHATLLGGLLLLSSHYTPKTVKQNQAGLKPYPVYKSTQLHTDTLVKRNIRTEKQSGF